MSDIVKRLRAHPDPDDTVTVQLRTMVAQCHEAADEIEALRGGVMLHADTRRMLQADNERLRADNERLNELFALKWDATQSSETAAVHADNERLRKIIGYLEDHADIPISVRQDARRHALEPKP